jgi:hypothetical protein
MSEDIPTPPMREVLAALLDAVMGFDHWRQVESGCGVAGPVVMAYRALGLALPPAIAEWVATSPDSAPPFPDPVGYPWSTNPRVPGWQRNRPPQ